MKNKKPTPWIAVLCVAALVSAPAIGTSRADTYHLHEDMTQGNGQTLHHGMDLWLGGASGHPKTFDGHDFISNGFRIRTSTSNFTFGNADTTLTLSHGGNNRLIVRTQNQSLTTIPNLISLGGGAAIQAGGKTANLAVGNFTLSDGDTRLGTNREADRTLILTVDALTGDGSLVLLGGNIILTIKNGLGYTGDILWGDGANTTLRFGNSLSTKGGLVAFSDARIFLDQDVSFARVMLGDVTLDPGKYTYENLSGHAGFGSLFLEGGSGSITVLP